MARIPATATCCRFNVRVNSLWLWWYAAIVVVSQTYLMYRAVEQCKEYNELAWSSERKPVAELYVYIILLVLSIMCVPFFILTSIFKVGNYANDGVRLGRDDVREGLRGEEGGRGEERGQEGTKAQGVWKHFAPLSNSLHVFAAFTLLLPRILLDAQKVRHGFLPADEIWRSELDVVFGRGRPEDLRDSDAPYQLTLNQTARTTMGPPGANQLNYHILPISPEFVNWVLALIIYSLRYPAVFWYTRKIFSMVFAFLLFAATFQYVFAYCAIGILYKYQSNANLYAGSQLVLPYEAMIVLYLLTNTFVFASAISIFNYGYYHYDEAYRKFMVQHRFHRSRRKLPTPVGCQGYVPHSIATITLMLFVASRATVVYDVVTLYRNTRNKVILASVVWDVCYMLIWIITWFVFTIKQSWDFRIHSTILADSASDVYTIRNEHARDSQIIQNTAPHLLPSEQPTQDVVIGNGLVSPEDVNVDVMDSAPNSPTSALRRSGDRRGNVRVTFEEDDQDQTGEDLSRQSPKRRSKEGKVTPSRRRKRRSEHPDVSSENRGEDPTKNVFGDYPLQVTPENTLTRSYRHSIRDKCGQYYRHSREFQSPPAAQSSPVLGQRNGDHSSGSHMSHEPSRDSVTRDLPPREIQPPPRDLPPRDIPLRDIPPRDIPPRDLPPRDLPPRESLPLRESNPKRRSGSREPERPPRPARNLSPSRSQPLSSSHLPPKPPPIGGERVLPPKPHLQSKALPQPPPQSDFSGAKNYPQGMVRNNLSTKPPMGANRGSDRHPQPNRDIRVIAANGVHSKKPEMGRRDSALPSSNETSSNDSSDNVLCSQV